MTDIARIRRWFADELRYTVPVKSLAVVEAFATVPREQFLDPGPWTLKTEQGRVETPDTDPAHVYHDVLIPLDEAKDLNNGSPSLWAELFDALNIQRGESIVHIGAGRGYYTAILAELTGPSGHVTAIEIEPRLAQLARDALAGWRQIELIEGDGFTEQFAPCDVIVLSAGVSHFPASWLRALRSNGRIMVPLTVDGEWPTPDGTGTWRGGFGKILLATKRDQSISARFVRQCGFVNCVGGHALEIEDRLRQSFQRDDAYKIKSLRQSDEARNDSCWFDAGGWWLSSRDLAH